MWSAIRCKPAVTVSLLLSVISAHPMPQTTDAKLELAKATADRIVGRFHQTLDFKQIFAGDFVQNKTIRAKALSMDNGDQFSQFDMATHERVYVTFMTFLHLWGEYMLIQKENDVPPEIEKRGEPKLFSHGNRPWTLSDLNQALVELESISAMYRKHFTDDVFRSARYHTSISEAVTSSRTVPRIDHGNTKFGIPESVPVYVVRPEAFDYYFVEENGEMKLFYVNILPDFRLF